MSLAPDTEQRSLPQESDDGQEHYYCCTDQEAICGADLSDYEDDCVIGCTGHIICPLCQILYQSSDWRCRFCGEGWAE